jgi:GT2 family glycosyltransferase
MESVNFMENGDVSKARSGSQDVRPRVSVIVVTYCSRNEIPACVDSLQKQAVPVEIFLVDNASPDDTAEVVSSYAQHFDNIHAILNQDNIGLAAGNNAPLGKCQGDYVLILNPDTALRPDTLAQLVTFLDRNPDVGVVGPKNVYEDGTPHSSFHRHWGLLHVLVWRVLPFRFTRSLYDRFSKYEREDKLFVSGACLMIRRDLFERIGGYDPEYFLTVEDACDVCIRARKSGARVVFMPEAEVVHLGGRSGSHAPYIVVWQGYYGTIYHFLKHKGQAQALIVLFFLLISSFVRCLMASVIGIFKPRYRDVARIFARVSWNLLVRSPFSESGPRVGRSTRENARFDGASY